MQSYEKNTKKRKVTGIKKGRRGASQVIEESSDESDSTENESLVILDCINVK